jgi:hypothetical protein
MLWDGDELVALGSVVCDGVGADYEQPQLPGPCSSVWLSYDAPLADRSPDACQVWCRHDSDKGVLAVQDHLTVSSHDLN